MENVGPRSQEALRQTKPWVRMFSVLFMLGGGLILLMALVVGALSMVGGALGEAGLPGGVMGMALALIYGTMSLLYLVPGLHLWRYASAIGRMLLSEDVDDLAEALEFQRSFWKFAGMMFLILIVLYFVIFAVMIVFGVVASTTGS